MNVVDIIQKAIAGEYVALIQYYNTSAITLNPEIKHEFIQHAKEEAEHVVSLMEVLKSYAHGVEITPANLDDFSPIKYNKPAMNDVSLLKQNIFGEIEAVNFYKELLKNYPLTSNNRKKIKKILDKALKTWRTYFEIIPTILI